MDPDLIIGILLRWMHILAAVTAVGGTIFARLALVPSLDVLNDESRSKLHEAIRQHWAKPVQISIGLLLVSGIINAVSIMKNYDVARVGYYHAVFGIKFLLAFVVFFLASALTGHGKATQRFRDNRRYWLTVNMVVAITIVCLSGVLRKSDPPRKPKFSAVPALQSPVTLEKPAAVRQLDPAS
jgi:uncharacterized membrane protein